MQQTLKKKPQKKDLAKSAEPTFTSLELRQGKADAEMLVEKKQEL